jgi:2'-hydroxyisoflavone reductase
LLEKGVVPFAELPLWLPSDSAAIFRTRTDRALAAGLKPRPLADTVQYVMTWDAGRDPQDDGSSQAAGSLRLRGTAHMSPEREAALIAAWRSTQA